MGYKFTLVLSREINDDESKSLQKTGCPDATITTTAHPTNAGFLVTQIDIDTEAASLAVAIQSALDAVKKVSDLSASSLIVPPQPNGTSTQDEAGEAGPTAIPIDGNAASAEDAAALAENGAASGATRSRKVKRKGNSAKA